MILLTRVFLQLLQNVKTHLFVYTSKMDALEHQTTIQARYGFKKHIMWATHIGMVIK